MLKAKLLKSKPNLKEYKTKNTQELEIEQIKMAMSELNLNYKRVDEIDIYNIFKFLNPDNVVELL